MKIIFFDKLPFNNDTHCWFCEEPKRYLYSMSWVVNPFDGFRLRIMSINACKGCKSKNRRGKR